MCETDLAVGKWYIHIFEWLYYTVQDVLYIVLKENNHIFYLCVIEKQYTLTRYHIRKNQLCEKHVYHLGNNVCIFWNGNRFLISDIEIIVK